MRRIALVASEKREFEGLLKRWGKGESAGLPVAYSCRVMSHQTEWLLVADGQGAKAAARACSAIPEWQSLDAIGSIGYAGGLRPQWRVGDVVWGTEVQDRQSGEIFPCWIPEGAKAASGRVLTVERVIRQASEKRRLGEEGSDIVEMEAAAVARSVRESLLNESAPLFLVVKAVSDSCEEDLAFDFDRARRQNGSIRASSVLAQALHRPLVRLPQLGKLARAARLASDNLGAALAALVFVAEGEGAGPDGDSH